MKRVKRSQVVNMCFGVIIAVLFSGCSATTSNVAPDQLRPAFSRDVIVFENTIPENIKYSVIGDFVSQKGWYGSTDETASSALKDAAAKGANGVLIEAQGHRATGFCWASPYTEGKLLWIDNYDMAHEQQKKEQ